MCGKKDRSRRSLMTVAIVCSVLLAIPVAYYAVCYTLRVGRFDITQPRPSASDDAIRRHDELCRRASLEHPRIVFLGDSITQGWETTGADPWDEYFAPLQSFNMGVFGDRIQNLLWRLVDGALEGVEPEVVVLLIGTNNSRFYSATEIVRGIHAVVDHVRDACPQASIVVLALLPRGSPNSAERHIVGRVNRRLQDELKTRDATFVEIGDCFLDESGEIPMTLMPDRLHPSSEGYRLLAERLYPMLRRLLQERQRDRG